MAHPRMIILLAGGLLFLGAVDGEPGASLGAVGGLAFGTPSAEAVATLVETQRAKLVFNEMETGGPVRLAGGVLGVMQVRLRDLYFINDKLYMMEVWLESENPFIKLEEVTEQLSRKYGMAMQRRQFADPYNLPSRRPDLNSPGEAVPAFLEGKAHFSSKWIFNNGTVAAAVALTRAEREVALILTYTHAGIAQGASAEVPSRLTAP